MTHEMVMLAQVGPAVQKVSYNKTARLALSSIFGLVHIALTTQFSIIALRHHAFGFAIFSITTFVFCNICGQLVLLSCNAPPDLMFKARSFEVMHKVLSI